VTLAGHLLFDQMQEALRIYVNETLLKRVEIIVHKWRSTDCAQGAAILSLNQIYKESS
jgi:hypothetical protein